MGVRSKSPFTDGNPGYLLTTEMSGGRILSPCSKPPERFRLLLPGLTHRYVDDRYPISMRFYRECLGLRPFSVLRDIEDDTTHLGTFENE